MGINIIKASDAARYIHDGDTIGLSGFTSSGSPKAICKELVDIVNQEKSQGKRFKVNFLSGASAGQIVDGDLAELGAIGLRSPFIANRTFRDHANNGEIDYVDLHISSMAESIRRNVFGKINWAIIEICDYYIDSTKCYVSLTTAIGVVPTLVRCADKILLEHNSFHHKEVAFFHDIYEPMDAPFRKPIPITHVKDRIGTNYVEIDIDKIVGIVECNIPDEAHSIKDIDASSEIMGEHVANTLFKEIQKGIIPRDYLTIQSGIGKTADAVLKGLSENCNIPNYMIYTEVLQDVAVRQIRSGRVTQASSASLTITNETLNEIYSDIDFFKKKIVLRPSEISNSPEVIKRLGVVSINTAIECDIYGNVNSSHICGRQLMNGIGGSNDYARNSCLSFFITKSTLFDDRLSAIVPMCTHIDSTEHDVDFLVTEFGVADLRGKCPTKRAEAIINNCAHPDYRPYLRNYVKQSSGRIPHNFDMAYELYEAYIKTGDMRNI